MSENNAAVRKLNLLIDQIEADDFVIYFKEPVYVCGDDAERRLDGLDFIRVDVGDDWLNELKQEVVATFIWLNVHNGRKALPLGEDAENQRNAFRKVVNMRKTWERQVCLVEVETIVKGFDGKKLVLQRPYRDKPFEINLSKTKWSHKRSPAVSDYLQRFHIAITNLGEWREVYYVEDVWA